MLIGPGAFADDFSSFIPGYKKSTKTKAETPSRKLTPSSQTPKKEVGPYISERIKCNKDLENAPVIQLPMQAEKCVKNLEQAKTLFPEKHKIISKLSGTWSDFHVRDHEDKVYERQQKTGLFDNDIPIQIVQNQLNVRISSEGFVIQTQDFDDRAKLSRSESLPAELCSGPSGFFFKSGETQVALQFKSEKCLWVGQNGKWSAQRKFEYANDFGKAVTRSGVQ